ncbi:MAG TPA: SulP family inorganic anion transporter, partial [Myxococcota bacterium]|nr:SulP family inorganic anion transporter [Myxococcota bacterium]
PGESGPRAARSWLAGYPLRWLPSDALAGVTLAAYAVPVGLAYASLAGLPPQAGVYGFMLGGIGYALLGTSRQLAIGPTSAISLLVGVSIAPLAQGDPARYAGIAALVALLVAGLALAAFALRLANLTHFISESILMGFKAGAGISIALTQLPDALGVPGGGEGVGSRLAALGRELGQADPAVVALSLGALALLIAGERFLPRRPVSLAVVVLGVALTAALGLHEHGVPTVGAIPAGLPALRLPELRLEDVNALLPLAVACLLLGYIESLSAARALAAPSGEEVDAQRELLALGGANLAAALGQGFPVAGGLSQSVVNEEAGARSPVSLLVAAGVLGLALVFLTDSLRDLPRAVLAAIVLVSVLGLVDVRGILRLRRASRIEFNVAMTALAGVLVLGILRGVLLAVLASILLLLHRLARPHVAFLGRIPGTLRYSDLARHPDNERIPGVLAVRVEASLLYFNVDHVLREVTARIASQEPPVKLVVWDLSTSPYVDLAGARMFARLSSELAARNSELRLADAHAEVRDLLREEGLEAAVGHISRRTSVEDLIEAFQKTG